METGRLLLCPLKAGLKKKGALKDHIFYFCEYHNLSFGLILKEYEP
jgi:hypothetical protein